MLNKTILIILSSMLVITCGHDKKALEIIAIKDTLIICFDNLQKLDFEIQSEILKTTSTPLYVDYMGKIVPSHADINIVSATYPGVIRNFNWQSGQFITKGALIAEIENPELLKIQEDFLNKKSDYLYFKEDFKRQGELNLENATSMKVMQKAQQDFEHAETGMRSLSLQLKLLEIDPDSLSSNNLQSSVKIFAPVSGILTDINIYRGMFCNLGIPICKISENNHPQIEFSIDSGKVGNIQYEQKIEFEAISKPGKKFLAVISDIKPSNSDSHLSIVSARMIENKEFNVIGTPVKIKINLGPHNMALISDESIIEDVNRFYIIKKRTDSCFSLTEVIVGNRVGNKKEIFILSDELANNQFVTTGAHHIFEKLVNQLQSR